MAQRTGNFRHGWRAGGLAALVALTSPASAAECLMKDATYTEAKSGAVIQFHPTHDEAEAATTNVFDFSFPHATLKLPGQVTYTNGRRSLPDTTIRHECTPDDIDNGLQDATGLCPLWNGLTYGLSGGEATWIPFEDDRAPEGLLFPNLGDNLVQWEPYYSVNENGAAWDSYKLTGCAEEQK